MGQGRRRQFLICAAALGRTIARSVLLCADEVIE
jgi:hypothetical protein